MDFHLTETQQMTRRAMREFVRKEVVPLAQELDEKAEFPVANYRQALELDILEITLPEALGGIGDDFLSFVIALEEFACGNAALAFSISVTEAINHLLCRYGSKNQQQHIEPLRKAEAFGAAALGVGGSDVFLAGTADKTVDGVDILLNGTLPYVPLAAPADMAIIFASSDTGINAAYLVDKQMPGLAAGKPDALMGMQSLPVGRLEFNDVRLTRDHLLGSLKQGRTIYAALEVRTHLAIAALAVGISRAALEEAVNHSKNRIQFGRPLAQMEATQNKIADMAARIEAARLLVYQAAFYLEMDQPSGQRAAMAKLIASEVAVETCKEAVQIHGGYGYVKDYPVERLYRDALFTQIYHTTNETQRYKIARQICRVTK